MSPPNVVVPAKAGNRHYDCQKGQFLGPEFDPMMVGNPNDKDFQVLDLSLPKTLTREHLEDRRTFLNLVDGYYRKKIRTAEHTKMDRFSQQALEMITSPEVRQAFDLSRESEKTRDAYGRTSFGQSLLLARRLVESGSRFITAAGHDLNGWDTHSAQRPPEPQADGESWTNPCRSCWRTSTSGACGSPPWWWSWASSDAAPTTTPRLGRDHWPHCWSLLLGGGGIEGGKVVGASDDRGAYVAERRVTIGDLFATLYKAFGIDWHKEYMSPIGRPVKIANSIDDETGQPVSELI